MILLVLFLFLAPTLLADELTIDPPQLWQSPCGQPCVPIVPPPTLAAPSEDNVLVDLIDPIYEDGVLTTEQGGVLSTCDLRIQAQKITYIRKLDADPPVFSVTCAGNLLIDHNEWVLIGDVLHYDFLTHRGFLCNGKTASPPWFIGGREVFLQENGDIIINDGWITTSEGEFEDVAIHSAHICLSKEQVVVARNVTFRVNDVPVFWLPKLTRDLKNIGRSPFAVKFGWGGFKGSYLSLLYHFLSWKDIDATARIDAFTGKGLGFGIETAYDPNWRPTRFFTRNYIATDISLADPKRKDRYRFQGTYYDRIYGVTVNGMYDVVSDAEMAADYTTKDFALPTAKRTQLELRRKEQTWIANLFTRVRVNRFQSVNQELPSFQMHLHPFEIPYTGIILENTFKASYLNYVFSQDVVDRDDFDSTRIACHPFLYRPFFFGPFTATPEAGFIGIAYSKSPHGGGSKGQALAEVGVHMQSALTRHYATFKHVAEPYLHYQFLSHPTVSPKEHFIFTIDDGWERLNIVRFGVRNSFFVKIPCGIERPLWIDLWANAFIDTPTVLQAIPRGYINIEWLPLGNIFVGCDAAWHFQEHQLDFFNTRIDWTLHENFAIGMEYRYRSRFDWRKADFYNFILESVRTQQDLLDSALSDRRDTFLLRFFYRLSPVWTAKFDLRHGWHQKQQKSYLEYQIEATRLVFQHWRMKLIYEQRAADHRVSFSLLMDPGPPPKRKACF